MTNDTLTMPEKPKRKRLFPTPEEWAMMKEQAAIFEKSGLMPTIRYGKEDRR